MDSLLQGESIHQMGLLQSASLRLPGRGQAAQSLFTPADSEVAAVNCGMTANASRHQT